MGPRTAIVIGAGPAGLISAIHLQRAGLRVTVLEAKKSPGGRAASEHSGGFTLNQGPHALYLGGAGARELRALGIKPAGRIPPALDPLALDADGRLRHVVSSRSMARLFAKVARSKASELAGVTALEWAGSDPLVRAFTHVATYTGPLDRLSADVAVRQLRIAGRGVRYLHGGWQSIVDALTAVAGDVVRCSASVRELRRDDAGWVAVTDDDEVAGDVVIVASGGPERASRLLGVEIEAPGPEATASILDLGLERLPRRSRRFATSLTEPRYCSVHTPPARMAESGVLVAVAGYGRASRDELESFADAVQPGWRDVAMMTRYLPAMRTITAIPTPEHGGLAGRPGPEVPGLPGAFVAGDWVGPEGILLDAAASSAVAAARAAVRAPVRQAVAA